MTNPILIAINGNLVRALGEPNLEHYGVTEASPAVRLIHALARSRVLGFTNRRGPCIRMSREYAEQCDSMFVTPGDTSIFPPPVGMFRGAPVYIDDGSNCVVVDWSEHQRPIEGSL